MIVVSDSVQVVNEPLGKAKFAETEYCTPHTKSVVCTLLGVASHVSNPLERMVGWLSSPRATM